MLLWIFPIAALVVAVGVWFSLAGLLWLFLEVYIGVFSRTSEENGLPAFQEVVFGMEPALWTIGIVLLVIVGSSLHKMYTLRGGGLSFALLMKGIPIHPGTTSHERRRLLNVVEEMAIASGMTFYLYNEVSTMALKSLTGVSHSVANTAKRAVVIVGSAIAFGEDMGFMKTVGCSVAIGGTFLYAIADDIPRMLGFSKKKKA